MVLNLALGLALGRTLYLSKDGPNGYQSYWQEAVYKAATIEGLVTAIPREERPGFGMAYLGGLLHSFGYLILAEGVPPYFSHYGPMAQANPHVMPQTLDRHVQGAACDPLAGRL